MYSHWRAHIWLQPFLSIRPRSKLSNLMLINDWGDMSEAQEPTLDREFLSSLKDLKILLDKEKEHQNAVLTKLKKPQ